MRCPKCGKEVDEEDRYCSHCGHPLEHEPKEMRKEKKECLFIGFLAFVFFLMILHYSDEAHSHMWSATDHFFDDEPEWGMDDVWRTQRDIDNIRWIAILWFLLTCYTIYLLWKRQERIRRYKRAFEIALTCCTIYLLWKGPLHLT